MRTVDKTDTPQGSTQICSVLSLGGKRFEPNNGKMLRLDKAGKWECRVFIISLYYFYNFWMLETFYNI